MKQYYPNKLPFGKQECIIVYKDDKKNLYEYTLQKWVHIKVLIKINVCIF